MAGRATRDDDGKNESGVEKRQGMHEAPDEFGVAIFACKVSHEREQRSARSSGHENQGVEDRFARFPERAECLDAPLVLGVLRQAFSCRLSPRLFGSMHEHLGI
jgi:hypothetical protein